MEINPPTFSFKNLKKFFHIVGWPILPVFHSCNAWLAYIYLIESSWFCLTAHNNWLEVCMSAWLREIHGFLRPRVNLVWLWSLTFLCSLQATKVNIA